VVETIVNPFSQELKLHPNHPLVLTSKFWPTLFNPLRTQHSRTHNTHITQPKSVEKTEVKRHTQQSIWYTGTVVPSEVTIWSYALLQQCIEEWNTHDSHRVVARSLLKGLSYFLPVSVLLDRNQCNKISQQNLHCKANSLLLIQIQSQNSNCFAYPSY
jgi:hypothetical protein